MAKTKKEKIRNLEDVLLSMAQEDKTSGAMGVQGGMMQPGQMPLQGQMQQKSGLPTEQGLPQGTGLKPLVKKPTPKKAESKGGEEAGKKIGRKQIEEAILTLHEYKRGKANLEHRIIENEQWYKLRHWEQMRLKTAGEVQPVSAWLFNSIANKHADAMDNYPMPSVLPREAGDEAAAKQLSAILPVILDQNDYEQTYSDKWWYKLKTGTGVEGVFWNPQKMGGLGDIEIRQIDLLNLFWEPGIKDIQASRHFFHVELADNEVLENEYPQLKNKLGGNAVDVSRYLYDESIDTSKKTAVVDWYYKVRSGSKDILHYCKFVNDEVLYSSEDDPEYEERGFYDHGKYPFVFDVLFLEEGMPTGFGYIDIMKDPQMYIDKLNQVILTNAMMTGKKRFFIRHDGSVNEEEFADWSKDFVHVAGSNLGEDSIREINVAPINSMYLNVLNQKIDEMKETSGNRDFSQGGTTGGVTAASAIAALQEAGSKLSRDMIKSSYRAFTRVNYLCLELIRQFYDEPRCFRITGDNGGAQFVQYDNGSMIARDQGSDFGVSLGMREPVFDIKITSQKNSPFSRISQNELAKEFYAMGFFNPQMAEQALVCMEMMDFEGKDIVMQRLSESLARQQQQQQAQMQQMMQMQQMAQAQQAQGRSGQGGQAAPGQGGAQGQGMANGPGMGQGNSAGANAAANQMSQMASAMAGR